jgi:hypothetical protein
VLHDVNESSFDEFRSAHPPGSFLRITAPARLFDARYVARAFGGLSATVAGLKSFVTEENASPNRPAAPKRKGSTPVARRDGGQRANRDPRRTSWKT